MPITFDGDDLNLGSVAWNHLITQHGLESAATMHGWVRKSQWFGTETTIQDLVHKAFKRFMTWAGGRTVTLATDPNGRSVVDIDLGEDVGTGTSGKATTYVRLVLEINHSGTCHLVTAFPL